MTLFTDVSSSGWGAQLVSRLTQGQWSASQRSWHINVLEMQVVINTVRDFLPHLRSRVVCLMCDNAGRHQHCERLPASSEVPGGLLDVRQRSDCGLHQERGRHTIVHTDADDDTPAQVVRSQGDHVGSRPSARSAQHPGGFAVQSGPDTEH